MAKLFELANIFNFYVLVHKLIDCSLKIIISRFILKLEMNI